MDTRSVKKLTREEPAPLADDVSVIWDVFYGGWDLDDPKGFLLSVPDRSCILVPGEMIDESVFKDMRFCPDVISKVFAYDEGYNDGDRWEMVGVFKNGIYFYFEAYCDNTGFDCRGEAWVTVAKTYTALYDRGIKF